MVAIVVATALALQSPSQASPLHTSTSLPIGAFAENGLGSVWHRLAARISVGVLPALFFS